MGAFLPLLFVFAFMGLTSLFADNVVAERAPPGVAPGTAAVQDFLAYRNAVLRYVEANPGVGASGTATVATPSIALPAGATAALIPASAGNQVVGASGSRTIYVWWPGRYASPASLGAPIASDATIGIVDGGGWETAGLGAMGPLPLALPAGDLISVVEVGGS